MSSSWEAIGRSDRETGRARLLHTAGLPGALSILCAHQLCVSPIGQSTSRAPDSGSGEMDPRFWMGEAAKSRCKERVAILHAVGAVRS